MKMCCNPFFLYEKIIICKDFVFDFEKGAILEGQFERKGPFHFPPKFLAVKKKNIFIVC